MAIPGPHDAYRRVLTKHQVRFHRLPSYLEPETIFILDPEPEEVIRTFTNVLGLRSGDGSQNQIHGVELPQSPALERKTNLLKKSDSIPQNNPWERTLDGHVRYEQHAFIDEIHSNDGGVMSRQNSRSRQSSISTGGLQSGVTSRRSSLAPLPADTICPPPPTRAPALLPDEAYLSMGCVQLSDALCSESPANSVTSPRLRLHWLDVPVSTPNQFCSPSLRNPSMPESDDPDATPTTHIFTTAEVEFSNELSACAGTSAGLGGPVIDPLVSLPQDYLTASHTTVCFDHYTDSATIQPPLLPHDLESDDPAGLDMRPGLGGSQKHPLSQEVLVPLEDAIGEMLWFGSCHTPSRSSVLKPRMRIQRRRTSIYPRKDATPGSCCEALPSGPTDFNPPSLQKNTSSSFPIRRGRQSSKKLPSKARYFSPHQADIVDLDSMDDLSSLYENLNYPVRQSQTTHEWSGAASGMPDPAVQIPSSPSAAQAPPANNNAYASESCTLLGGPICQSPLPFCPSPGIPQSLPMLGPSNNDLMQENEGMIQYAVVGSEKALLVYHQLSNEIQTDAVFSILPQTEMQLIRDLVHECSCILTTLNECHIMLVHRLAESSLVQESWSSRTAEWHERHMKRATTLHLVLTRLAKVVHNVDLLADRPALVLVKLRAYQRKLDDLNKKMSCAFLRLRIRNLYAALTLRHRHDRERRQAQALAALDPQGYELTTVHGAEGADQAMDINSVYPTQQRAEEKAWRCAQRDRISSLITELEVKARSSKEYTTDH